MWYLTGKIPTDATLVQVCPGLCFKSIILVFFNDLVDNISSDPKLFADGTSLFTVVYDEETSAIVLNNDLNLIKRGLSNGKCSLTLISKQLR